MKTSGSDLSVESDDGSESISFVVHELPIPHEPRLAWWFEVDGALSELRLQIQRTLPISAIVLSLIPLLFLLRHLIALLGNVSSAIATTLPLVGVWVAERALPAGSLRIRARYALTVILLALGTYGCLVKWPQFLVVLSQDDIRVLGGHFLSPGVLVTVPKSASAEPGSSGCVWTNGKPSNCLSDRPFLSPADRVTDWLDSRVGTPVHRLRCSTDAAGFLAVTNAGNPHAACTPMAEVPLLGRAEVHSCTLSVKEAAGACGFIRTPVDAWIEFEKYWASFRYTPRGSSQLRCRDGVCSGQPSKTGISVSLERLAALELSELCGPEDAICAVRSRFGDVSIAEAPIPNGLPFALRAANTNGELAGAKCRLQGAGEVSLRALVLEDARWIRSLTVIDTSRGHSIECSPRNDLPEFAALVPVAFPPGSTVRIVAIDEPSQQTIVPFGRELSVSLRRGEKEWTAKAKEASAAYARVAKLVCPPQGKSVSLSNDAVTLTATSTRGPVDTLFFLSVDAKAESEAKAVGDEARRCSILPGPTVLPIELRCAELKSKNNHGLYNGPPRMVPWCANK